MHVQCLLWDFGDTLCDELSLWRVSPEWMEVYHSFDDGLGAAWSLGDLDTRGFVAELAKRMPLSEAEILAHLRRSDLFEFFPFTHAFFRGHHLPQAIVTVNPTLFSETIVPGSRRSMLSRLPRTPLVLPLAPPPIRPNREAGAPPP